jgi:DNA-binding transcriptional ArsR family regulator
MPADLAEAAPVFAALGDPTRLGLVNRLSKDGPLAIVRLATGSTMSRQAITKHLRVLADARLVNDVRRGREHIWELDPARVSQARRALDQISAQWDDALARLKAYVEE